MREYHKSALAVGAVGILVWSATRLHAENIVGSVTQIQGEAVTISIDSKFRPSAGDPVVIFVELPDVGEVEVAKAKVAAVVGNLVIAKIEKATGRVTVGRLAKILVRGKRPATDKSTEPADVGKSVPMKPPVKPSTRRAPDVDSPDKPWLGGIEDLDRWSASGSRLRAS